MININAERLIRLLDPLDELPVVRYVFSNGTALDSFQPYLLRALFQACGSTLVTMRTEEQEP
jgi:hypothetical protein